MIGPEEPKQCLKRWRRSYEKYGNEGFYTERSDEYYNFLLYEIINDLKKAELKFLIILDINFSSILFNEGYISIEEIQKYLRKEMASYRTEFIPNADGGINYGELYGGSCSSK